MLHFDSDYLEGAHPAIIERLVATNLDQTSGYGTDEVCERARARIREACEAPDAAVYFLVGGTQTNAAVADQILRPWEGSYAPRPGTSPPMRLAPWRRAGERRCRCRSTTASWTPPRCARCARRTGPTRTASTSWRRARCYISHPTEYGTVYSLAELEELAQVCRDFGMRLFMDGARLGYGLAATGADVTLPDIARLCDAFYIGGTKVGALCGEAVVFTRPGLDDHFFTLMKKRGALLAKGRFLGLQFDVLFEQEEGPDGTLALRYENAGRHAVELAQRLADGFRAKGYELHLDSPTNPAVRRAGRRRPRTPRSPRVVRLLGAHARRPHRRALRHQLGHPTGSRGRTARAVVDTSTSNIPPGSKPPANSSRV